MDWKDIILNTPNSGYIWFCSNKSDKFYGVPYDFLMHHKLIPICISNPYKYNDVYGYIPYTDLEHYEELKYKLEQRSNEEFRRLHKEYNQRVFGTQQKPSKIKKDCFNIIKYVAVGFCGIVLIRCIIGLLLK